MMHGRRVFRVVNGLHGERFSPASLARTLTEHDWTTCSGFRIGNLVFLNDATSADGAQEYAVFDELIGKQIESLTVGWMKADKLEAWIVAALAGHRGVDPWGTLPSLAHPEGSCHACA